MVLYLYQVSKTLTALARGFLAQLENIMSVLTLAADNGFILANLRATQCGDVNLVLGNHQVKEVLDSAYASIQEDIQDMCADEHSIGGNMQTGCSFKYLRDNWKGISQDADALTLLNDLLLAVEPTFKEMTLFDNGVFKVLANGYWQDAESMSQDFQYIAEVALQAYGARWGVVMFHNIEKAGARNITALTDYLMNMGALRENRTILSTQSMDCVKAFNSVAAKRTDIDSVLVTIEGNNTDNCDIMAQAANEAELSSKILTGEAVH